MNATPASRDQRHNVRLALTEMWRWPKTTAIGLVVLAAMTVTQLLFVESLDPISVTIGVVGYVAAALGLKTLMLLMFNPVRRKEPFQGSYLVTSFITMVPIFVFYALGFYLMSVMPSTRAMIEESPPMLALAASFAFAYVLFSIFFAGFLRALHTILMHNGKISELTDKGRIPAPRGKRPPP